MTTFVYNDPVPIISAATIVGKVEANGNFGEYFDKVEEKSMLNEKSFEKAEQKFLENACNLAINKAGLTKEDINLFLAGDLMNQIISSNFTARNLQIPYLGLFGACSTCIEALGLGSFLMANGKIDYALAGSVSHNNSAEKQFRYPNEYGAQKKPISQLTVTGAGAGVLGYNGKKNLPNVTSFTIGKVVDLGIKDPFNMGAAMAPAALDSIINHFKERKVPLNYYDLILTGDLGRIGHKILVELLANEGYNFGSKLVDGGMLIYPNEKQYFAGGSGAGCISIMTYGYIYKKMLKGELNRVLLVGTGALMSPLSSQQKESIPGIAQIVSLEII